MWSGGRRIESILFSTCLQYRPDPGDLWKKGWELDAKRSSPSGSGSRASIILHRCRWFCTKEAPERWMRSRRSKVQNCKSLGSNLTGQAGCQGTGQRWKTCRERFSLRSTPWMYYALLYHGIFRIFRLHEKKKSSVRISFFHICNLSNFLYSPANFVCQSPCSSFTYIKLGLRFVPCPFAGMGDVPMKNFHCIHAITSCSW